MILANKACDKLTDFWGRILWKNTEWNQKLFNCFYKKNDSGILLEINDFLNAFPRISYENKKEFYLIFF